MSIEKEQAAKIAQLEGLVASKTHTISTAEEALGVIANAVGRALERPTSDLRSAKRGSELAALVVQALARNAAAPPTGATTERPDVDALAAASIESLKARIVALEGALETAGIDPITVRGEEPKGWRDGDASRGGRVVAGAADDLAAAFAASNTIEPDRS